MAILASGQVAATKSTIFEVTDADILDTTEALILKVSIFNTGSSEQTTTLFVKEKNSTSRQLRQFKLKENESGEYIEPGDSLPMDHGDVLQAQTSAAGLVDYVVIGNRL